MPVQTTATSYIYFPDGCKVEIDDGTGYSDLGAINSAVTATLEYTENEIETANAGNLNKHISDMKITGGFTLINLDPDGVEKLGGDMFTKVDTSSTAAVTDIDDQVLTASSWTNMQRIPLVMVDTSDDTVYIASAAPTIDSVTGSTAGALAAGDDYFIIADTSSPSGYSIQLNTDGTAGVVTTEVVTIAYTSVTPIASETLYMGTSTISLTPYSLRFTHTDGNSKIRRLELFSAEPNSGAFQFNFKGANEEGVEEMPVTFTAKLDTSLTDGRQLAAWTIQTGAA